MCLNTLSLEVLTKKLDNLHKPNWVISMLEINQIHNMDCRKGLKQLPDNFVDLIVTDPPYGIDLDYGYKDDWRPDEEVWKECYRVLKDNCLIVMTTSNKHLPFWIDVLRKVGFNYVHCGVYWNKCRAGGNCNGLFAYAWEPILYFAKGTTPKLIKRMLSDVYPHTGRKTSEHPAERDINAWRKIMEVFDGKLVLDPFMGSGTTAKVSKEQQRDFIGFEISKEYCDIANKRLSQENLNSWR